jgi:uncharacterized paraquat-inducible protein A
MIRSQSNESPVDQSASREPKSRQCLKCRADFPSEWSGERVCPRCKKKTGWRSGVRSRAF